MPDDDDVSVSTIRCTACGEREEFPEDEYALGWLVRWRLQPGEWRARWEEEPLAGGATDPDTYHTLLCENCKRDIVFQCSACSDWYDLDNEYTSDYESYCEDCFSDRFYYCEDCEEPNDRDYGVYVEGGERLVCEGCGGNYLECYSCGEYYHTEDMHYDDDEETDWCSRCWRDEERDADHVVNSYSYRPVLMFRWSHSKDAHGFWMESNMRRRIKHQHFYGTELEVEPAPGKGADYEVKRQMAEYIHQNYGDFLYLKRDGSIPSGFEIVSHPASMEWWLTHGTKMYADILMRLRNAGFQSHNGGHCGLHIHTNKAAITTLQAMKMTGFMFNENNKSKVKQLSRRSTSSLRTYASIDVPNRYDDSINDYRQLTAYEYAKEVASRKASSARNALYFGRETAELRLFRGTLRDDRLWASLQFFDLLIQYTKAGEPGDPNWAAFRNYVFTAPRQYSDLQSLFMEKQL